MASILNLISSLFSSEEEASKVPSPPVKREQEEEQSPVASVEVKNDETTTTVVFSSNSSKRPRDEETLPDSKRLRTVEKDDLRTVIVSQKARTSSQDHHSSDTRDILIGQLSKRRNRNDFFWKLSNRHLLGALGIPLWICNNDYTLGSCDYFKCIYGHRKHIIIQEKSESRRIIRFTQPRCYRRNCKFTDCVFAHENPEVYECHV